jgi:hypothetical protein
MSNEPVKLDYADARKSFNPAAPSALLLGVFCFVTMPFALVELLHNNLSPFALPWSGLVAIDFWFLIYARRCAVTTNDGRGTNRVTLSLLSLSVVLGSLTVLNTTSFFGTDPHVVGRRVNTCGPTVGDFRRSWKTQRGRISRRRVLDRPHGPAASHPIRSPTCTSGRTSRVRSIEGRSSHAIASRRTWMTAISFMF